MDENGFVTLAKDMYRRREGDKVPGLKIHCPSIARMVVNLTAVS